MTRVPLWLGLLAITGCVNAEAKLPESWGSPPPPASIAPANPDSKADLLRENRQLRDRAAWLEDQNRKLAKKSQDLQKDAAEVRADSDKIAADRDRYKRAAGR